MIKKLGFWLLSVCLFLASVQPATAAWPQSGGLIVDHTTVGQFDTIPSSYINQAKSLFYGVYFHTSHGSQIFTGMDMLMSDNSLYDYFNDYYHYRFGTSNPIAPSGTLSLWNWDGTDLGNPSMTAWVNTTRTMLNNSNGDYQIYPHLRNLVMWSWCGQVSTATYDNIANDYLANMNQLETEFPNVAFVYMTGHLDGSGPTGNLYQRNQQIRDYCIANNKVLFDFADIESWDPAGNYYPNESDTCQWCSTWCSSHSCPSCSSCAHSHCFNCYQKGKAFWWMMARLAGWNSSGDPIPTPTPNPISQVLTLLANWLSNYSPLDFVADSKINGLDFSWLLSN
ncbi:hypothetical protein KKD62_00285 [Patescibacteria group bacterium]|nr:hypothetical protein [Patescibacteria group bacterium]MBU1931796.1 hypothetical protein [Patescibacteria group bacterium]